MPDPHLMCDLTFLSFLTIKAYMFVSLAEQPPFVGLQIAAMLARRHETSSWEVYDRGVTGMMATLAINCLQYMIANSVSQKVSKSSFFGEGNIEKR